MFYVGVNPTLTEIQKIYNAAEFYKSELLGRSLLVLYLDSHSELNTYSVTFLPRNFMHLTGLIHAHDPKYNSVHFYNDAILKRLKKDDFYLGAYTTNLKLEILESALANVLRSNMIGTYDNSGPLLITERVVGTVNSCIGFVNDKQTGLNYPNTLLNVDIRRKLRERYRICAIFRKRDDEEEYSEATYIAKRIRWDPLQFPGGLEYLKDLIAREELRKNRLTL